MIATAIALAAVTATTTPPPAAPRPAAPARAAAAPSPPSAPSAPRGAAALKALGMSDAGIKVLRQQSAPDPDARALLAKRQAMRAQVAAAAAATPFDVDGFAALLRESSLLEGTARARSEERIVTTLKALPAADRPIFAKAVFGGARAPNDAPPPPQTPKPTP